MPRPWLQEKLSKLITQIKIRWCLFISPQDYYEFSKNQSSPVTSAGTGIGKAAAKALLQGGYCVVLTGRSIDKLEKAIEDIRGNSNNCLAVSCDVGKPDEVKKLFAALRNRFGRIDVLFNNAGMVAPAIPMEDLTYEQWMNVVNANLCGAFLCS